MEESEIILPPSGAHWSLRPVDIMKPFPDNLPANVTFKILRFFYPPFAVECVELIHVVSNPELNIFNVGLFLIFSFLTYVLYVGVKHFLRAKHYFLRKQALSKSASEKRQLAGNIYLPNNRTNVIMQPQQLTESADFIDTEEYVENHIRYREMDLNGDKHHDLAGKLNRAVRERSKQRGRV